jgi:hypothetical protein
MEYLVFETSDEEDSSCKVHGKIISHIKHGKERPTYGYGREQLGPRVARTNILLICSSIIWDILLAYNVISDHKDNMSGLTCLTHATELKEDLF